MGAKEADFVASRLPRGGNLLEIRGVAGTSIDDAIHNGVAAGVIVAAGGEVRGRQRLSHGGGDAADIPLRRFLYRMNGSTCGPTRVVSA